LERAPKRGGSDETLTTDPPKYPSTPEPHQVEGHYDLVEFDSEPPWVKSERAEPAPFSVN